MSLQIRVKFPSDYPVIYKTVRLDSSLTVKEAVIAIGEAINVASSPDLGLYLPDQTNYLSETQTLSSFDSIRDVQYIELKSKKSPPKEGCCIIM
ncbi:hypothetical protein CYY_009152 [Polysphondylium violaceum]|uniref:Ubiquitin-like domain-containing protein n=1 Tax=Polysphondylium violaceum TaxID=133409 RepID=A0A8J4V0Q4_9MYCE|nr:hypothetical protein CYY_009152 [Polysphondylium violaceum]